MACNSGGPLESVEDGVTGFLTNPDPKKWAQKIFTILDNNNKSKRVEMKVKAKERVKKLFTIDVFAKSLESIVKEMK